MLTNQSIYESGGRKPKTYPWSDETFHLYQSTVRAELLKAMWNSSAVLRDGDEGHACLMGPGHLTAIHVAPTYDDHRKDDFFYGRAFSIYSYKFGKISHLHGQIATKGRGLESDVVDIPIMMSGESDGVILQTMPLSNEAVLLAKDGQQVPEDITPDSIIENSISHLEGAGIDPYKVLFEGMDEDQMVLWYVDSIRGERDLKEYYIMFGSDGKKMVVGVEPENMGAWRNGDMTSASIQTYSYLRYKAAVQTASVDFCNPRTPEEASELFMALEAAGVDI